MSKSYTSAFKPSACCKTKGFSLIEVLVVMTIMGFLSAGVATLISHQMSVSAYLDDKASRRDLKVELDRLLSDPSACLNTLASINIPNEGLSKELTTLTIKTKDGSLALQNGNSYDQIKLGFELKNLDIANLDSAGLTELNIRLKRLRSGNDQEMQNLKYRLNTTVDITTRAVSSCIAETSSGGTEGDCLRPVQVRTSFPVNVPSDADAIGIMIPTVTRNYKEPGSGKDEGANSSCTVPSRLYFLKLDGTLHQKFKPNRSITKTSGTTYGPQGAAISTAIIKYDGVNTSHQGNCGPGSHGDHEVYYEQNLNVCRKASDPNFNTTQGGVMFYKYNSKL